MNRYALILPLFVCLAACGGEADKPPAETPSSFGKKAPRVASDDAGAPPPSIDPATDGAMPTLTIASIRVVEKDTKGAVVTDLGGKEGLAGRMSLKVGDKLDADAMKKDVAAIARLYHDAGYAHADVDAARSVDMQKGEVALDVTIKRGELARIDAFQIEGNASTPEKTIRKEIKLAKGALYSETKLDEAKARIVALDSFASVTYRVEDKPSKTKVTVTFVVTEK